MHAWFLWALVTTGDAVLVGIGSPPSEEARREALYELQARGERVLTTEEALPRLCGMRLAHAPDVAALLRMLLEARERDAHFDAAGADALRAHILAGFEATLRPELSLLDLVAEAMKDAVASRLAEGDEAGALAAAREMVRRFGHVTLDEARHPERVRSIVARARQEIEHAALGRLLVQTTAPGSLIVDGRITSVHAGTSELALPHGRYRAWLYSDGHASLPHAIVIGDEPAEVHFELAREDRLFVEGGALVVRCDATCADDLEALSRQLAARVVPLTSPAPTIAVTGEASDTFSLLSVAPFAVGQFAQGRPVVASGLLATQLGLLGWHVAALAAHTDAVARGTRDEPDRRRTRNVSAAFFYASVLGGVVEAVTYELLR